MEGVVFCGVDVPAERETGHFEVESRGEQHVAGGQVLVDEAVVGQVLHGQRHLVTHGDLLGRRQRGQLLVTLDVVLPGGPQELLQVTL